MNTLLRDLRYGVRMLRKKPAFTLIAIVSLALGIGANTTVFSVINAVLLKSLPFKDPESLVLVWGDMGNDDRLKGRNQLSATDVADFRAQTTTLEDVAPYMGWNPLMSGDTEAERVPGIQVGDGFFKVMRGTPILGRVFTPEEQEEGKDFVIVLGHGLWQRRYNSNPNIVGTSVLLNGRSYTIVGVMGPDFQPLPESLVGPQGQLYRPIAEPYDDKQRDSRHVRAIARLKPGVTVEQAHSDIQLIARRLEQQHPTTNKYQGAVVVSITDDTVGGFKLTLWLIFGAVVFVLLVACANVANLLLAKATVRQKEITIRAAIGAGRAQIVRQLLTESLLLSFLGGGLGLLLAMWGTRIVENIASRINPLFSDITIDYRTLLFTFTACVLTGLIFGVAPALHISKFNLTDALRDSRGSAGSSRRNRVRSVLVVTEVALTLVLLVCAGLLIRTVVRLRNVETGFNSNNVLTMNIGLPSVKYPKPENVVSFYKEATERIAALPGVKAAGVTSVLPLSDNFDGRGLAVEDYPKPEGEEISVDLYVVTPGYLRAMEIPLRHGRAITDHDTTDSAQIALINQTMADQLWPNQDPLGRRIKFPGTQTRPQPWRTIVGVVSDVAQYSLDKKPPMQIYLPHSQFPTSFDSIVVKTENDPTSLFAAVRREIQAVDKDQAVFDVRTLEDLQSDSIALRRFFMLLLMVFAILTLTLAAVGIYGVMSYAVTQRTQEIGIRMALGARAIDVLKLVVTSGIVLALTGVGIGLIAAFALTRLLQSILFGVTPTDALTFTVGAVGLVVVAVVACYIPARRATKVDPVVALRYE
ncbi:MAG TPA: ABC transporter permease [Pyrinomonadaceae bacterium]|nr:ABC transporter permease [Pyrinomonadaceae bacterium]